MDGTSIQNEVILGVDTHLDIYVGVAINNQGKVRGTLASIPTNEVGYLRLLTWVRSLGNFRRVGVEGTGAYGAGLARLLREQGIEVLEINRPDRAKRRLRGKSDPTDAESAARTVLSGNATARTQAINQLRSLLISAPDDLRERLWKAKPEQCVTGCARLRNVEGSILLKTLTTALRLLAKRWLMLSAELKELDATIDRLTSQSAKRLRNQFGVEPQTAVILIAVAGDNPERIRNEAALAALCGATYSTGNVK